MEIRSLYKSFLNRLRSSDQIAQAKAEGKKGLPENTQIDRRELSSLVAVLQEAEHLEEKSEPADLARLKKLEKDISSGDYEINLRKLAEAMLHSPEDLSGQQGEDK